MNVKEFLQLDKPEIFDFSGEFASEVYRSASPCEKYIIYKAYTINNDWADCFASGKEFCAGIKKCFTEKEQRRVVHWIDDPDNGSELLQEVYNLIWPFMFDDDKNKFWSDTLSSVQYTMADVFENFIESDAAKTRRHALGYKQNCTIRYMLDYFSNAESDENVMKQVSDAAAKIENILYIDRFLSAWHTIGNYCPVPKGFNAPRSNYGKHDMWDLSLMKIRQWYLATNDITKEKILVEDLFHFNKSGDVKSTTEWLTKFGDGQKGWESFVDTFLFQDWVNTEDVNSSHYYEVVPLCENHDWANPLTPVDNLEEFFCNYQKRIYNRGIRIIDKLREL